MCQHPPTRHYAWVAYDGILCIGCCACGEVLKGAADEPAQPSEHKVTLNYWPKYGWSFSIYVGGHFAMSGDFYQDIDDVYQSIKQTLRFRGVAQ
jgi:hypothetical protein